MTYRIYLDQFFLNLFKYWTIKPRILSRGPVMVALDRLNNTYLIVILVQKISNWPTVGFGWIINCPRTIFGKHCFRPFGKWCPTKQNRAQFVDPKLSVCNPPVEKHCPRLSSYKKIILQNFHNLKKPCTIN